MESTPSKKTERPISLRKKTVSGIAWSALEIWGRQAGTFIVFVILARLLTPADFGLVAVARIFLDLTLIFIRQGMSDAIVQRSDVKADHLDTAFWMNVGIGLVAMVVFIAGAPFVEKGMNIPGVAMVLVAMSPTMLIVSINVVQDGLLRRDLKFKTLAIRRIGGTLMGGSVGIGMALSGFGVWSLVGQQLAGGVFGAMLLWYSTSWRPGTRITRRAFDDLFGFSFHIFASNVTSLAARRADSFLIGRFLGPAALGLYDVASRVMWFLVMALTSVSNRVSFSTFSRLNQEPEKVRRGFYELTSWTTLLSFPSFAGVAILSPWIVPLVFGTQWLGSVPVMQVISWLGVSQSLSYFNSTILRAMGAPKLSWFVICVSALWNIIGFLLVVDHGIVAVAWVFLLGGVLTLPLSIFWVGKVLSISWVEYTKNIAPGMLCTAIMASILYGVIYKCDFIRDPSVLNVLILIAIGLVSYVAAMAVFARKKLYILISKTRIARGRAVKP